VRRVAVDQLTGQNWSADLSDAIWTVVKNADGRAESAGRGAAEDRAHGAGGEGRHSGAGRVEFGIGN
jgi:hypothetical protein